jgi:choline dehydrogenase-like flavoprotein
MATRDGPLAKTSADTWGFMRLPDNDAVMARTGDPSAGPTSAHTEILFGEGFFPLGDIAVPQSGNYITVLSVVTSPTSRGSVTLDSLHQPVIDPNYMTTESDQHVAVQGMKDVFELFAVEALEGYIGEPYGPLKKLMTDEELLEYVRRYASTINHGVGTARMSPRGEEWGAVDPDLKVKGTRGVRIVDASVFVSRSMRA